MCAWRCVITYVCFWFRAQVCVATHKYRIIPGMDKWCENNCVNFPSNCPEEFCTCPWVSSLLLGIYATVVVRHRACRCCLCFKQTEPIESLYFSATNVPESVKLEDCRARTNTARTNASCTGRSARRSDASAIEPIRFCTVLEIYTRTHEHTHTHIY